MKIGCWLAAAAILGAGVGHAAAQSQGRGSVLAGEIRTLNEVAGRTDSKAVIDQFVTRFEKLAGTRDNARTLIVGLRSGQEIVLKGRGTDGKPATATFTPPTGTMSFGNVFLTLSITEGMLAARGYPQPGPEQLQIALMGGKLPASGNQEEIKGILVRRLSGEGWGIIASTLGIDLDPVVTAMRSERERFPAVAAPSTAAVPSGALPAPK